MLAAGGAVYALGAGFMAFNGTLLAMQLTAGVLVGIGLAGGSFTVVIAALGRLVFEDRRSWAMGLATAAGSFGQFVLGVVLALIAAARHWPIVERRVPRLPAVPEPARS